MPSLGQPSHSSSSSRLHSMVNGWFMDDPQPPSPPTPLTPPAVPPQATLSYIREALAVPRLLLSPPAASSTSSCGPPPPPPPPPRRFKVIFYPKDTQAKVTLEMSTDDNLASLKAELNKLFKSLQVQHDDHHFLVHASAHRNTLIAPELTLGHYLERQHDKTLMIVRAHDGDLDLPPIHHPPVSP